MHTRGNTQHHDIVITTVPQVLDAFHVLGVCEAVIRRIENGRARQKAFKFSILDPSQARGFSTFFPFQITKGE
jgi:hypothetical protein